MEFDDNGFVVGFMNVHHENACNGRLCDFHGRRGMEPWASWPRHWRYDRVMVEMIDPSTGIGHPSPAQAMYWKSAYKFEDYEAEMVHGCDGGCYGAYDQI